MNHNQNESHDRKVNIRQRQIFVEQYYYPSFWRFRWGIFTFMKYIFDPKKSELPTGYKKIFPSRPYFYHSLHREFLHFFNIGQNLFWPPDADWMQNFSSRNLFAFLRKHVFLNFSWGITQQQNGPVLTTVSGAWSPPDRGGRWSRGNRTALCRHGSILFLFLFQHVPHRWRLAQKKGVANASREKKFSIAFDLQGNETGGKPWLWERNFVLLIGLLGFWHLPATGFSSRIGICRT